MRACRAPGWPRTTDGRAFRALHTRGAARRTPSGVGTPPDLTCRDALEECQDGHPADLGVSLETDTWRHVCLIQELEPLFADELAVSQETSDPLGWQDVEHAPHKCVADS